MARPPRGKQPSKPAARRRPWLRWIGVPLVALLAVGVLATGVSAFWVLAILPRSLPSVTQLESIEPSVGSRIYDEADELITEFHVERRIFVPLGQMPPALKQAIIATEDARFYSHFGVDPMGIARAVYQNFRRGRILEVYLNQIYFGHGAFGVEAASRTFFGKGVSELSPGECALLAGLPKAPATYSPFDHPEAAKRRRAIVLTRMVDTGAIRADQAKRVGDSALSLVPPERRRTTGQYYLEYVQQYLEAQYGPDLVFKGGLHVYTTLSPTMQLKAESTLREGLRALETRRAATAGKDAPAPERPEGALLALEPQTGYIRAMVGGYDFFKSEFNRAVQARRQPGSAFKPFVYIAALEAGLTPASVVDDSPVQYPFGANGKIWKPDNYDRKFRGPITYQQALEESINVATIKVQERIGVRRTVDVARRLGVESPLHENLSIALGTSDLTLLELTSAYGSLANQGTWVKPTAIRYVLDSQRKMLEENVPQGRQALPPDLAYVVTHMMQGTIERGTGQAAKALGRPPAAKPREGRDGCACRGADLDGLHEGGAARLARRGLPGAGGRGAGAGGSLGGGHLREAGHDGFHRRNRAEEQLRSGPG